MKNKENGYSVAELLMVVAIMGVLVAISMPMISGRLKKARAAVDVANVRSAKAAAVSDYLVEDLNDEVNYYYDACQGMVKHSAASIKAYGKSTVDLTKDNIMEDFAEGIPQGGIVKLTVTAEGVKTITWMKATTGGDEVIPPKPSQSLINVAAKSWEEYQKNSQYGISCPAGSLFMDQGQLYVFYRNHDYYQGDYRHQSLEDVRKDFPNCLKKITDTTIIKASTSYQVGDYVEAGTIVKDSRGQYLVRCVSNHISDESIINNSDNWVRIKGD